MAMGRPKGSLNKATLSRMEYWESVLKKQVKDMSSDDLANMIYQTAMDSDNGFLKVKALEYLHGVKLRMEHVDRDRFKDVTPGSREELLKNAKELVKELEGPVGSVPVPEISKEPIQGWVPVVTDANLSVEGE